jgi:Ca-activated chloride channel homolog
MLSLSRVSGQEESWFRSGVELINITATVTDRAGRFVPALERADFRVFEDDRPVEVTNFAVDRVPVSLGIVLDTSESMAGDKMDHARAAIERFLDRLEPGDEVFLWGFASDVHVLQEWTTNRDAARASLQRIRPTGATAMYDAVARAVRTAENGRNRKNAVLLISDGNDTTSRSDVRDVLRVVRETDVLVYAVGIDGGGKPGIGVRLPLPRPTPIPFPASSRRVSGLPGPLFSQSPGRIGWMRGPDRLNVSALREITDESGGRTETIRRARDLNPAIAGIADELSRQYSLGYTSPGYRDGQWHSIRVEMRDRSLRVRARRGYFAGHEEYACASRCD